MLLTLLLSFCYVTETRIMQLLIERLGFGMILYQISSAGIVKLLKC